MNCSQTKIKKVNKKLKKFEHVVLKETGVTCKYQPTKVLEIHFPAMKLIFKNVV